MDDMMELWISRKAMEVIVTAAMAYAEHYTDGESAARIKDAVADIDDAVEEACEDPLKKGTL